jgi:large subunit ribosomal protein L24
MNKFKKGDKVVIMAGKDKGKEGKILKVMPKQQKIIVENINLVKKHRKPTQNTKGGIFDVPAAFNWSKACVLCPNTNKPTRIGFAFIKGQKKRKAIVSGEIFD